jgi:hypothetical protein
MRTVLLGILGAFGSCATAAADAPAWSLELLIGDAHNFASHTRIERGGDPAIDLSGDYETRGFESPLHYALRIARWEGDRAWELELLHHKVYLQNRPRAVESLSVSHGFNVVSVNRACAVNAWRFRLGAGPVVAHPEASIAGVSYDGPYELAGAAVVGGAGAVIALTPKLSIVAEVSATYGYVRVHPDGEPDLRVEIRNPAIHAQAGIGYRF